MYENSRKEFCYSQITIVFSCSTITRRHRTHWVVEFWLVEFVLEQQGQLMVVHLVALIPLISNFARPQLMGLRQVDGGRWLMIQREYLCLPYCQKEVWSHLCPPCLWTI